MRARILSGRQFRGPGGGKTEGLWERSDWERGLESQTVYAVRAEGERSLKDPTRFDVLDLQDDEKAKYLHPN